jgi:hypothetical protein
MPEPASLMPLGHKRLMDTRSSEISVRELWSLSSNPSFPLPVGNNPAGDVIWDDEADWRLRRDVVGDRGERVADQWFDQMARLVPVSIVMSGEALEAFPHLQIMARRRARKKPRDEGGGGKTRDRLLKTDRLSASFLQHEEVLVLVLGLAPAAVAHRLGEGEAGAAEHGDQVSFLIGHCPLRRCLRLNPAAPAIKLSLPTDAR